MSLATTSNTENRPISLPQIQQQACFSLVFFYGNEALKCVNSCFLRPFIFIFPNFFASMLMFMHKIGIHVEAAKVHPVLKFFNDKLKLAVESKCTIDDLVMSDPPKEVKENNHHRTKHADI